MAQTTTCSDCSREISISATRCPHCGTRYPHAERSFTPKSAAIALLVGAIVFWLLL